MIISKMIINAVAGQLVKHFRLDAIMNYVFKDNELDKNAIEVDKRLKKLEKMAHSPKNLKCKCK
mgnify:CR=1 FL=1|tara:strand:+ start:900 stop:1091 length:192 start_codon:yes stop_codon:yes gene_type:complete